MGRKKKKVLQVSKLGPIHRANVELGDLTVLVGPQASGKSIFLQTLKLVMDRNHILGFFKKNNTIFSNGPRSVLNGYYGSGMAGMLRKRPTVSWDGGEYGLGDLASPKKSRSRQYEKLFYIPAQRVQSLPSGVSQHFNSFNFGDPYVLRYFGEQIHILLQGEFGDSKSIFPIKGKLNQVLKVPIAEHIFGDAELRLEPRENVNRLILKVRGLSEGLQYLSWSAGQREFAPLLLGLYWLCPSGGSNNRRNQIEWVVIEEPEMGLHPRAVSAFLLLALELMRRGYRVVISTHSTAVLDLVWAMREIQEHGGNENHVLDLINLKPIHAARKLAESALKKDYGVYFFERSGLKKDVQDISTLDPGSLDQAISNWGDLVEFAGRSSDVVSDVVNKDFFRRR